MNGDFNVQVNNIPNHLFLPFARELRRTFQRIFRDSSAKSEGQAPASDRTVTLEHNSAYGRAKRTLAKLEEALTQANDYPDQTDRAQRIAEINAGGTLLAAPRTRLAAISVSHFFKYSNSREQRRPTF